MEGWIKLHRSILDSSLWLSEPFTKGQAWTDMLLLTNHKPGFIRVQGVRIDLARGDLGWSEVRLAERWKWSRGKVRRFFAELKKDDSISSKIFKKTDKRKNIITISNYDAFQSDGTGDVTCDGHATDKRRYSNKNDKNDKKDSPPVVPPVPTDGDDDGKDRKGTRLPEDWRCSTSLRAYALGKEFDEDDIDTIEANFIQHFTNGKGKNQRHLSWERTWQTWVRNDAQRNRDRNGGGNGSKPPSLLAAARIALDSVERQAQSGMGDYPFGGTSGYGDPPLVDDAGSPDPDQESLFPDEF
jgi:hypothetical protein